MGAMLCCMSLSTSDSDESDHQVVAIVGPEQKEEEEKKWLPVEKKAMKGNKLATLEEWLLASPGMKPAESIASGELHVFKHPSKNKAHRPSSNRIHAELITPSPRESRIPLKRSHEEDHEGGGRQSSEVGSSVGRSQGGQLRKKVSFRRPEADVVIFYSPEGTSEDSDEHPPFSA